MVALRRDAAGHRRFGVRQIVVATLAATGASSTATRQQSVDARGEALFGDPWSKTSGRGDAAPIF
jgi:hypothetical protein